MSISGRSLAGLAVLLLVVSLASGWWRDYQRDDLGRQLATLARPGDIRMLSSTSCVYCTRARQWLDAQQVAYSECFIERDAACERDYRALGARGTPTLLVRGELQLGFQPLGVLKALQRGG